MLYLQVRCILVNQSVLSAGLTTFRSRHIKCDEGKPECLRCISQGRKCGGYKSLVGAVSTSRSSSVTPTTPEALSEPNDLTLVPYVHRPLSGYNAYSPNQLRAMEFFCRTAAPQLSGYFHAPFWQEAVLKVSDDEPAVRYAVIALSALVESDSYGEDPSSSNPNSQRQFALESYNQAIQCLVTQMDNTDSIRVPLMTCIIFICIDCLLRNIPVALKHIEGGIKMVGMWKERHQDHLRMTTPLGSIEYELIEDILIPVLAWINLAASNFGIPSFSVEHLYTNMSLSVSDETPFHTWSESSQSLQYIGQSLIGFLRYSAGIKFNSENETQALAEQLRLIQLLDRWRLRVEGLVQKIYTSEPKQRFYGGNVLLASHLSMKLWLQTCLCPYETAWDQYKSQYEEILQLSEAMLDDNSRFPNRESKSFSFEICAIPAIQFVAYKCRWPAIRRKALLLLRASPQRECLFDTRYSHALYERVMILEELGLNLAHGEFPSEDQLPPETARIHQIDLYVIRRYKLHDHCLLL
jgi:hypothetical protein